MKFDIELPAGANALELPDDDRIAVFAVTLSDNPGEQIKPAAEMRALPLNTVKK